MALLLDDYKRYKPSESCYLDGRYFNKVFKRYPGLVEEPLHINISKCGRVTAEMKYCYSNTLYNRLIRVVITTPTGRHDTLLILEGEKGYWFDPFPSQSSVYIQELIAIYFKISIKRLVCNALNVKGNCKKSGFCTAYIIKYAYDYLKGVEPDMTMIKSFVTRIEKEKSFKLSIHEEPDISYGIFGSSGDNAALGALLGVGVGGLGGYALGGVGGALVGAGVGGLGGYALGGGFK